MNVVHLLQRTLGRNNTRLHQLAQSGVQAPVLGFVHDETCCTLLPPSHLKTSDEGNAPNRMVVVGSALDTLRSPLA